MRTRAPLTAAQILEALERAGGDLPAAARELGVSDRTLYRRMAEYGIRARLRYEPAPDEAAVS
jgi:transcriptional regulator of acetoin/glycerol metabolism